MANNVVLQIKDLCAGVAEIKKPIIKNLSLEIKAGETHAVMGPNGAGKSTLAYVLTGKPGYEVTSGEVKFCGKDLLKLTPSGRACEGLFLSMQNPVAVPGVTVNNFLKHAVNAQRKYKGLPELDTAGFLKLVRGAAREFDIGPDMLKREINVGFSGGEKKRLEILQLSLLQPELAILDEADSGLDIDALRIVADGVNQWHNQNNALLVITHHIDLLRRLKPDFVHVYSDGHIVRTGGAELAGELEESGYKEYTEGRQ